MYTITTTIASAKLAVRGKLASRENQLERLRLQSPDRCNLAIRSSQAIRKALIRHVGSKLERADELENVEDETGLDEIFGSRLYKSHLLFRPVFLDARLTNLENVEDKLKEIPTLEIFPIGTGARNIISRALASFGVIITTMDMEIPKEGLGMGPAVASYLTMSLFTIKKQEANFEFQSILPSRPVRKQFWEWKNGKFLQCLLEFNAGKELERK